MKGILSSINVVEHALQEKAGDIKGKLRLTGTQDGPLGSRHAALWCLGFQRLAAGRQLGTLAGSTVPKQKAK